MLSLADRIAAATRAAFEEARRAHPSERFYVFALFSEDGDDLQPTCNSEEALARRLARGGDELELRWFAEEFEYHQLGERHFAALGERPARRGMAPAVAALQALDREGFFGKGAARARVAVLILRSDQSNREIVELARKLNPRAVAARIEAAFDVPKVTGSPRTLPGKEVYSLDSLARSADGKTVAAAGWFGGAELRAWRVGARSRALPLKFARAKGIRAVAVSPDGSTLWASDRTAISRWSLPSGTRQPSIDTKDIESLAVSPDGQWLAASDGRRLWRWRLDDAPVPATKNTALAGPLVYSPNGSQLVGVTDRGEVVVLDADDLTPVARHSVGGRSLRCVAASNTLIAAGGYEAGAPIVLFGRGEPRTLPGHARGGVTSLAFSDDGKRLVSGGEDGHVRVFDVAHSRLLADVRGRAEAIGAVMFLPDGQFAACGRDVSNGPPVYVWPRLL